MAQAKITLAFAELLSKSCGMDQSYRDLHQAYAALGIRLFTVTVHDVTGAFCRRSYTSHPDEYPVAGTKPIVHDGWYDLCIAGQQTYVANTAAEFSQYFFDHALITLLGLGSCINIPVVTAGKVLGTINLLAEENHFTPDRLAAYEQIAKADHPALIAAMSRQMTA